MSHILQVTLRAIEGDGVSVRKIEKVIGSDALVRPRPETSRASFTPCSAFLAHHCHLVTGHTFLTTVTTTVISPLTALHPLILPGSPGDGAIDHPCDGDGCVSDSDCVCDCVCDCVGV